MSYAISQYFQMSDHVASSRSFPDTFEVSPQPKADGSDMRYDVCEAVHCSLDGGNCTDFEASEFGAEQLFNSSVDDIFAQCVFVPFHSEVFQSPFIYFRAWFRFHEGTPADPSSWRSGPYKKEWVGNHTPSYVVMRFNRKLMSV